MTFQVISRRRAALFATLTGTLLLAATSFAQEAQPEKARALLDQIKKSDTDRQLALKQTEIDRLKEDQEKTERDSAALQQTIDSTTSLISDSGEAITNLSTESRRLEHELTVTEAKISAEKLKVEGLRAMSAAQGKSLSAMARHGEEAAARGQLRTIELGMLQEGKSIPAEGSEESAQSELAKARKAVSQAMAKADAEERAAHLAMKDALAKMSQAEARAAMAQRLSDNDLTAEPPPIAERKTRVAEKNTEKRERDTSDAPVRRTTPKPAAIAVAPKATPAPVATPKPRQTIFTPRR